MEDTATAVEDAPRRNKPRLAIKKMVLENFKSYAGAQHVGPFHKVSWNSNGGSSVFFVLYRVVVVDARDGVETLAWIQRRRRCRWLCFFERTRRETNRVVCLIELVFFERCRTERER